MMVIPEVRRAHWNYVFITLVEKPITDTANRFNVIIIYKEINGLRVRPESINTWIGILNIKL
jgi:hypothetical protein